MSDLVGNSEDRFSRVAAHMINRYMYLLCLTIRITAMVDEPGDISFCSSINDLFWVYRHEVEMLLPCLRVLFGSTLEQFKVQHFSYVFHDELASEIEFTESL